jgi:tripartite-type tricarboxylate transporter receptor subunit TctC
MRLVVGYGAGGVTDVLARVVAQEIGPRLGQPVVVENRVGANGQIAAVAVKTAAPDGYTLYTGSVASFSPTFMKDNPVVATKELAPISVTAFGDWFLYAPASINVSNLKELAAYAKANPTQFRFAAPSQSNTMLMAAVAKRMGFEFENIPYKTTDQTIQAMLSGDAQVTLNAASGFEGFVNSGKVRAIATLGEQRSPLMPAANTANEQGVPLSLRFVHGLWTTIGTPREAINRLSGAVIEAVKSPAAAEKIKNIAMAPGGSSPEDLIRATEAEARFYADAAAITGFKPQ